MLKFCSMGVHLGSGDFLKFWKISANISETVQDRDIVTTDLVQGLDSGNVAVLALLDMTAAFDSVDHVILLERLRCTFWNL